MLFEVRPGTNIITRKGNARYVQYELQNKAGKAKKSLEWIALWISLGVGRSCIITTGAIEVLQYNGRLSVALRGAHLEISQIMA